MELLAPFLQGTSTPYNMPVYPGAQCIIAYALIEPAAHPQFQASDLKPSVTAE